MIVQKRDSRRERVERYDIKSGKIKNHSHRETERQTDR